MLSLWFQRRSCGKDLLERVFVHVSLAETDFFGLRFSDVNGVTQWLDPFKEIKKQSRDKGEQTLLAHQ
jgi:erythrocyte membrane protein band 4.1